MKRRPNNHRSKHKDKRSQEGQKFRRQRDNSDKKADKYGVSVLLESEPSGSDDE